MANSSDSDTESESQKSLDGWDATEFAHISTTQALCSSQDSHSSHSNATPSARDVELATGSLSSLDLSAVENDTTSHDVIQNASSSILFFLNYAISSSNACGDELEDIQIAIAGLVHSSFISLLFDYRRIFHRLAARDLMHSAPAVVVCWVDVILAKLGDAIFVIASRRPDSSLPVPEEPSFVSLEKQKEGAALRAATQLPEKWNSIPNVIAAEHASPAARRLALHLVFGVYVVGPQLGNGDPWSSGRSQHSDLVRALRTYIERISVSNSLTASPCTSANPTRLALYEATSCAMLLSLFSTADLAQHGENDENPDPFRPHTQATLLNLVYNVMSPAGVPTSALALITPLASLNAAQSILLRWGQVVPWCWAVWSDPRIANSEIIDYTTASWLYHLGHISTDLDENTELMDSREEELSTALMLNYTASIAVVIRILHYAASSMLTSPPAYPSSASLDIIHKSCLGASQLLHVSNNDDKMSVELCGLLCRLFILLHDTETETSIKDLVIEGLTLVSPEAIRTCMKTLCDDPKVNLIPRLEQIVSRLNLALEKTEGSSLLTEDVSAIRQLLHFVSLMGLNKVKGCFHQETLFPLLFELISRLASDSPDAVCLVPLDSIVNTLAILEMSKSSMALIFPVSNRLWEDETVFRMVMENGPTDLLVASAFAAYVSAVAHHRSYEPLLYAEAWNYLRDVLLLILTRHFLGEEEPLALLVSSTVCQALCSMWKYADKDAVAVEYFLSSPWTMNMCAGLKDIIMKDVTCNDTYNIHLRNKVFHCAELILKLVCMAQVQPRGLSSVLI
ncbi:hypothetical protein AcV5_004396 [Taiwanofungus camphoratus]|nr:hypothetical protein AcV5_004396 [Antrodia cinnamomea]